MKIVVSTLAAIVAILACACSTTEPQTLISSAPIEQDGFYIPADSIARSESTQCIATTQKGTRCKRVVASGSSRCWQHGESISTPTERSYTPSSSPSIQTGPRGGQYYINKNGKKTYIKKK